MHNFDSKSPHFWGTLVVLVAVDVNGLFVVGSLVLRFWELIGVDKLAAVELSVELSTVAGVWATRKLSK